MAEVIQVPTSADFLPIFEKCKAEEQFFICVITGGNDDQGKSWCPDCVVAKPNIENIILKNADCKVLWCNVPTRAEWVGKSDHLYKAHEEVKAKGVPTVLLYADGQIVMRAQTDEDFQNEELLMAIAKHE